MNASPQSRLQRWIRVHIIRPIKRSHWVFQIGDLLHLLLTKQQITDGVLRQVLEQQGVLANAGKAHEHGLDYHERRFQHYEQEGPLKNAATVFRRREAARIQRELAKKNGTHVDTKEPVRRGPRRHIDASGNVVEQDAPPPPAEAADHDGDSDATGAKRDGPA